MPTKKSENTNKPARAPRRIGSEQSATRALILDLTERLMIDEGYAAATTRRVAREAGLTAPLVHYYFPTTDDLFLAVYRRRVEQVHQKMDETLASARPLHALWKFESDKNRLALAVELMALANHRKVIGDELLIHTERARRRVTEALETILARRGHDLGELSPLVLSLIMVGVARALVMESSIGVALGHDETRAYVERLIDQLEPE